MLFARVLELVEQYASLKTKVCSTTRVGYTTVINVLKADSFGQRTIDSVKTSEEKNG